MPTPTPAPNRGGPVVCIGGPVALSAPILNLDFHVPSSLSSRHVQYKPKAVQDISDTFETLENHRKIIGKHMGLGP